MAGRTLHRHLSAVQGGLGPWVYNENMTANVTAHSSLEVICSCNFVSRIVMPVLSRTVGGGNMICRYIFNPQSSFVLVDRVGEDKLQWQLIISNVPSCLLPLVQRYCCSNISELMISIAGTVCADYNANLQ